MAKLHFVIGQTVQPGFPRGQRRQVKAVTVAARVRA